MNVLARNINAIIIKSVATVLERVAEEYNLDASQLTETFITDDVLVCVDGSKKTPRPRAKRTVCKDPSEKKTRASKQVRKSTRKGPTSDLLQCDENGVSLENPPQESDSSNPVSSQENEEEISVEEIIVDGVTYLKDDKNNLFTHDLENPKRIGILLANNKIKLLSP